MGVFEVAGDERPESLLSSSVPQLEAVVFGFVGDVFGEEVDAYGGLSEGEVHWLFNRSDCGYTFR